MKKLTFTFFLIFILPLYSQQLPQYWIDENYSKIDESQLTALSTYLGQIISLKSEALDQSEESLQKGLGGWKLSGQKTDLAISKSGLLGISALKGQAAVELNWARKIDKSSSLEENSTNTVSLSSNMDQNEILSQIQPAYQVLLEHLPEEKRSQQAQEWNDKVLQYHKALREVAELQGTHYVPSKFRLDLSLSYSAPIFGVNKLSGDARVRLEWKIVSHKNLKRISKDQKIISKLLRDLDKTLSTLDTSNTSAGFKMTTVAIGLGLSKKGFLNFSKLKGETIGYLFFKKQKSSTPSLEKDDNTDYHWNPEKDKILPFFKRTKFRKGLKKSVKMANWFSQKLQQTEGRWEINKFKAAFTLSYKGFFGLAKTSSKGLIELYYAK